MTVDVEAMKAEFGELSDVVPLLPDEVNEMRQSAQHLADAAATLHNETDAARQDVANLLAHVRNTLPGFTVQADGLEKRLEASLDAAEKAWTEGSGHIEDGETAVKTAAEAVDGARQELMRALFDAGTRVDQASADGEAAIDHLEAVATDGAARVKAAALELSDQVDTLEIRLEHVRESVTESCELLQQRMKQFVDSVSFDIGVLLDRLGAGKDGYTAHVTEVANAVESAVGEALNTLGKRVRESVAAPLGLATENARIEIERLAAAASTQKEAVVKALHEHTETMSELKQAAEPMGRGIDEIHEAVVRMRQQ
jgi:uncharacterized phage infection (PIP) family protein YhgE